VRRRAGGDKFIEADSSTCAYMKLYRTLPYKRVSNEVVLSKQLLRSGTRIGANVEEAIGAQSKPDFLSKMSIAYKEARETSYWLRLLKDSGYLTQSEFDAIHAEAEERCRIIASIQKTTKAALRGTRNS
jgi:four helix bundle protein